MWTKVKVMTGYGITGLLINGGLCIKNISAEMGFAHFDKQAGMWDSFKIDGGMQNEKWKITR